MSVVKGLPGAGRRESGRLPAADGGHRVGSGVAALRPPFGRTAALGAAPCAPLAQPAVIAQVDQVATVLRSGKPLYGEPTCVRSRPTKRDRIPYSDGRPDVILDYAHAACDTLNVSSDRP